MYIAEPGTYIAEPVRTGCSCFQPQEFEKWFLVCAVDGLQDRVRQSVAACSGLPHNIFDTKLDEASKIRIVEIEDRLIKLGIRAQNPTQDFLMLTVGDCLHKQANHGSWGCSAIM